jgi:hypothetical protein
MISAVSKGARDRVRIRYECGKPDCAVIHQIDFPNSEEAERFCEEIVGTYSEDDGRVVDWMQLDW